MFRFDYLLGPEYAHLLIAIYIFLLRLLEPFQHKKEKRKGHNQRRTSRSVTGKEHKVQFEAEPMLNDTYTTAVEDFDSGSNNKIINQASELYKNINIGVEYIRGQI